MDDGGVNSVYYFNKASGEVIHSRPGLTASKHASDEIEKYSFLARAEHSHSLAAGLGFKTRIL